MSVVQAVGLRSEWLNREAGGAGGALDQYRVDGAVLQLGSLIPRLAGPAGLDFEHVNAPLRANGSTEVDVILGADVFDAHAAVIDYATESLFLKAVAAEPTLHLTRAHRRFRDRRLVPTSACLDRALPNQQHAADGAARRR